MVEEKEKGREREEGNVGGRRWRRKKWRDGQGGREREARERW